MTSDKIIRHWQQGAEDAFGLAQHAYATGKYELALFHCHPAVEKALKAAYMKHRHKDHPKIHNLLEIALALDRPWTEEQQDQLEVLSDYAVSARYEDPAWAEQYATEDNTRLWLERVRNFLSILS